MNSVAMKTEKTHYRKAFNSPYLSSADITEPTRLTIARVALEKDKTKKTKEDFNTAYFAEHELRPGEKLKPMILNATNSKQVAAIAGSAYIDDWVNVSITVYVDPAVKFGKDVVEGLRIMRAKPRRELTPESARAWANAVAALKRDGNLDAVLAHMDVSDANRSLIAAQAEGIVE